MSDFDGSFMETRPLWAPPSSPSPRTTLAMLNQTDKDLNPINEIFPQANLSRDHNDQSGQRPGLGERLASRIGFNPPTLDTENISPFAALFRNPIVPSPVVLISPGFSPSALLQSPMFSNSSQIIPLHLNTNVYESEVVDNVNTDLTHQPLNVDVPPQEDSVNNISCHESHVEPLDAPLVAYLEFDVVDEVNNDLLHQSMNVNRPPQEVGSFESDAVDKVNIISKEEERESKDEDDEEGKDEDHNIIDAAKLDVGSSSSKRRKFEGSNMIGAIRTSKTQRVILQMECQEENPDDGFRWRKYGRKVVKGNLNPRSYYKCTSIGCKVKKHVERGADDNRLLVTTYDGIHDHPTPLARIRDNPRPMNRSDSLMSQNRTVNQLSRSFSSLGPQTDISRFYLTGLSMLPCLPVNHQNSGFMYQNEEPMIDVIPDGTRVYNGIMDHLYANFGMRL